MAEIDRQAIGQWGPSTTMVVERGKIREFVRALHDDPDADPGEALVAPPTFLMTIAHWLGDLGATRPGVVLDRRRLLHGEQEFEYRRPIHAGEVLTFRSRVREVYEKHGRRGGTMLFVVSETEFRDAADAVVAYLRNTSIETQGSDPA